MNNETLLRKLREPPLPKNEDDGRARGRLKRGANRLPKQFYHPGQEQ